MRVHCIEGQIQAQDKLYIEIKKQISGPAARLLLGASGFGKTSLLRLATGLEQPGSGSILHAGTPLTGPDRAAGVVFQESRLFHNVEEAAVLAGRTVILAPRQRPDIGRATDRNAYRRTRTGPMCDPLKQSLRKHLDRSLGFIPEVLPRNPRRVAGWISPRDPERTPATAQASDDRRAAFDRGGRMRPLG